MRTIRRHGLRLVLVFGVLLGASAESAANGRLRGEVTDLSGGVLPGVTVVVSRPGGPVLATTATDERGRYELPGLPEGDLTLTFTLDGFETSTVRIAVVPGSEATVVERLRLARVTEEVVVYGSAPEAPVETRTAYILPPRRRPTPLPPEQLESICRPSRVATEDEPVGRITAHRYEHGRTLYVKGDEVVIDAGLGHGVDVGRNLLVVRRFPIDRHAPIVEFVEQAAGVVQVVEAGELVSTAAVVHACGEVREGDVLTAFVPLPVHQPEPPEEPIYDEAARVLFADAGQLLGAPRRFLVIDKGGNQGIRRGQRMTLFRRSDPDGFPVVLGDAVVIAVQSESATIRVDRATDAIALGDWAAPQR